MSNSVRAIGILRCKLKITKSGHSNMVTTITTIMVQLRQINVIPFSV